MVLSNSMVVPKISSSFLKKMYLIYKRSYLSFRHSSSHALGLAIKILFSMKLVMGY